MLGVLLLELAGDAVVGEGEERNEVVLEVVAARGVGEGLGGVRLGLADVVAGDGFRLGLLSENLLELGKVLVVGSLELLGGELRLLLDKDGDRDRHVEGVWWGFWLVGGGGKWLFGVWSSSVCE